ncbi:MAG: hypothetical protein E7L36_01790 [Prevotella bivia]|uniref:hypothetical protein n=1 Tax=Prevotella bivia TaxID=28125 RepID=UPI002053B959|nr:hypothetical protein [Prevotella bivia]MDU7314424.1 hypothetical protein [Prevotella bivia]MDZ3818088.1 hypothetical protein [Prevotella bivia]DAL43877.1 MAG TPA_asm: hypothetical protein [Caudoviricetes sp.]
MVLAQKTFSVRKNIHGKDGTPALTLAVIPSQLVFDTDESGAILTKVLSANTAKVGLYDGQTEVTAEKYNITPVNCTATLANGVLTITSVTKGAYSGRVDITATYKGKTRVGSVAFNVNANHVYDAKFEANEKAIEAIVSDTAVKEDGSLLSKAYSMFKMLSDKIRLFVTDGLKKAGIEITSDSVNLMGNKVKVTNNDKEASLFENGKLNANFIDAKKIVAEGVKAQTIDAENATFKNVNVEGDVKAESGKVGGFEINNFSLVNDNVKGMYWYEASNIKIVNNNIGKYAAIGHCEPTGVGIESVARFCSDIKGSTANKLMQNVAVHISASGADSDFAGNNALYIRQGCIKGFRLNIERIGARTYYIDKMDTFLINVVTTGLLNWYLPSDCEDGQVVHIVPGMDCSLTIHTQGVDRFTSRNSGTERSINGARIHQFVYDAVNHIWFGGWQKMMD